MNVFYFTSDLFTKVAMTSIVSLLENNKECDTINFYIVDDGISSENKNQISKMINKYGRCVEYINAPNPSDILEFPFKSRYQMGHSYVRMCIGTLLPQSVERVICLDSDTLIMGELNELWETDMQDNILAGVADCMNLKAYRKQFGLTEKELYCNAGVFLVDLKKWREQQIECEIRKIIREKNGNIFFFEQTLMNYACRGKILKLSPKYNVYTLFYAFEYENLLRWRRPTSFYEKKDVLQAIDKPIIVHFTRNFYMLSRPWVVGCDHPLTDIYVKYKEKTPWKQLEEDERTDKKKFIYKMVHVVPQNILAVVINVIYNMIRPKMWWKNE